MFEAPGQLTPKNPLKGVIGSISLLMLVAVAVQASAGVLSPALQARQNSGLPVVRLIAEVVRAERQVKRQEVRPALCRACPARQPASKSDPRLASASPSAQPTRLLVLLTSMPPPAIA
jgi:hypothetical protein